MSGSFAIDTGDLPAGSNYAAVVRRALIVGAVLVSLLPGPIAALGVLPAYRAHARFLVFYAPLVCLLLLGYLFYVRDSLARVLFADILDPPAPPDPYYHQGFGDWIGRLFRYARTFVITALPAVLLVLSFYCLVRYTTRLNESVTLASDLYAAPVPATARTDTAAALPPNDSLSTAVQGAITRAHAEPAALRAYTLDKARLDDIPFFSELTTLYIGIFAGALLAIALMILKEYARETMGLSDDEVMFGRAAADAAQ